MRAIVGAAAAVALVAALAAPFVPALRLALGAACHQDPARSFDGMALCARCVGLYCGLLVAAAKPIRAGGRAALAVTVGSIAAWVWGIDTNAVRLALGFALGWICGCYLITLRLCPNTAPAAPNYLPMHGSVTGAASRSATSR